MLLPILGNCGSLNVETAYLLMRAHLLFGLTSLLVLRNCVIVILLMVSLVGVIKQQVFEVLLLVLRLLRGLATQLLHLINLSVNGLLI